MEITSLILGASAAVAALLVAHSVMDHVTIKGLRQDMDHMASDISITRDAIDSSAESIYQTMATLERDIERDIDDLNRAVELKKDIV